MSLGRNPNGYGVLRLLVADHDEGPSADGGGARRRRGHGRGLDAGARPRPVLAAAARRDDHPVREMAPHLLRLGRGHVVDGVAQLGRDLDLVWSGNLQRHGPAHHGVVEDEGAR